MTEIERVKHDLIWKAQQGSFPDNYAVVTQVYMCESISAVVSQSSKAEFVASAAADFRAGLTDLANASLEISVKRSNDLAARVLAAEGGTPMFRAIRLKRNVWRDVRVEDLRVAADDSEQTESVFDELTPANIDGNG